MSDFPDLVAIMPDPTRVPVRWRGFPHSIVLLPDGQTLDALRATPRAWATFLIEPDCAGEALNGLALPEYLKARVPILMHARRARDLRPIMRRSDSFRQRGYVLAVLR